MPGEFKPPEFAAAIFECRKPNCRARVIVGLYRGRRVLLDAEPASKFVPVDDRDRPTAAELDALPPAHRKVRRALIYTNHHLSCAARDEHRGRPDYALAKGDRDE